MSDKKGVVIALGYFDGVHKGHKKVISSAVKIAKELNASSALFSFDDNLKKSINGDGTFIYNKSERQNIYKKLGDFEVFFAPVSQEFLSLSPYEFLCFLNEKFNVLCYVCGEDYTFGKDKLGTKADVINFAKNHNQRYEIVAQESFDGEKISSTKIKKLLSNGEIEKANELLAFDYSITGVVVGGREVGRQLGFPTANINIEPLRHHLKEGVYLGRVQINDKDYKAIINYGTRPTFNEDGVILEAHILDYSGNLYKKTLEVIFEKYLRDIKKFNSKQELLEQLLKDKEEAKNA